MKDPEQSAAFNAKFFLHGFMRDFRINKDSPSPSFLDDQRRKVKKFDAKKGAASLKNAADSNAHLSSLPISTPVPPAIPAPPVFPVSTPATIVAPPHPASQPLPHTVVRKPTAAPKASNLSAAPKRPTESRDRSVARLDRPVAGPGPTTQAIASAGRDRVSNKDLEALQTIDEEDRAWRGFGAIDDDSSEGEDFRPQEKTDDSSDSEDSELRTMGKKKWKGKRKASETDDSGPRTMGKKKGKGKVVTVEMVKGKGKKENAKRKEKTSRIDLPAIHVKTGPTVSPNPPVRPIAVPTGKLHNPPCMSCQRDNRACEIQQSGGACVNCRRYKHKCEYARPRKATKSTPVVESENESQSDNPPARHPRQAAAAARRAIKEAADSSPKKSTPRVRGKS